MLDAYAATVALAISLHGPTTPRGLTHCGALGRAVPGSDAAGALPTINGMDPLTLFGLFAVTAMVACYALEYRGRRFILAFAGACLLGSIYGFLQGAWPFGVVEVVWAAIALWRWRLTQNAKPGGPA